MINLCVAAAGVVKAIPVVAFTLAWTHSVEKVEWQEDWRIEDHALKLVAARVKGSGAGMEPGEGAVRNGPWWEWHPKSQPLRQLVLGNSGAAGEWRLCYDGACKPFSALMPEARGQHRAILSPCPAKP